MLHDEKGLKNVRNAFEKGDEVREGLFQFANTNRLPDTHLSTIGAFSRVTLGLFDRERKDYKQIPIDEQIELLSFSGNIVQKDTSRDCTRTWSWARPVGTAHGGHFPGGQGMARTTDAVPDHARAA